MEINIFFILIFIFIIGSLIITCLVFPFSLFINKQFLNLEKKIIFKYTFYFNFFYFLSFFLSFLISSTLTRFLYYYIVLFIYAFLIGVLFWILYFILYLLRRKQRILLSRFFKYFFLVFYLGIFLLGIYNFEKPTAIETFNLSSDKITQNYTFVHLSDIQYGSVSKNYMNNILKLALGQDPDFIVMTGDLVDFNNYQLEDFEYFNNITIPIYFQRGNHEFIHNISSIQKIVNTIDSIITLNNSKGEFNEEIELIGIDYNRSQDFYINQLDNLELNNSKFSILLFHEPKFVEYASSKGYDLQLYGHVHGGQFFPFTKIVDYMYNYSDGYFKINQSTIYVTDGAGLWGPRYRLGSQNEIVVFNLEVK